MFIGAPSLLSASSRAPAVKKDVLSIASLGTSPYVFQWFDDTDPLSALSPALTSTGREVSWSPNSEFLAVGISEPAVVLYKWQSGALVYHSKLSIPANPLHITWSPDCEYLTVAVISNGIYVFKRSGDSYSYYTTLKSGTGSTNTCWSPNGALFITNLSASPYIARFAVSSDSFVEQSTALDVPLTTTPNSISISDNNAIVAIAKTNSPTLLLYEVVGATLVKLPNPDLDGVDNGLGSAAFYKNTLAFANGTTLRLRIYNLVGKELDYVATSATISSALVVDSMSWGKHGDRIAMSVDGAPYLRIFGWDGTSLTAKSTPASAPNTRIQEVSYGSVEPA